MIDITFTKITKCEDFNSLLHAFILLLQKTHMLQQTPQMLSKSLILLFITLFDISMWNFWYVWHFFISKTCVMPLITCK